MIRISKISIKLLLKNQFFTMITLNCIFQYASKAFNEFKIIRENSKKIKDFNAFYQKELTE